MPWIESHTNLRRSAKLGRLARGLGISKRDACGLLHFLWHHTFDDGLTNRKAEQGDISHLEPIDLAEICEWDGDPDKLFKVMISSGWIDVKSRKGSKKLKIVLHDWLQYAGRAVRERERKRIERKEKQPKSAPVLSGDRPRTDRIPSALPTDRTDQTDQPNQPTGKTETDAAFQSALDGCGTENGRPEIGKLTAALKGYEIYFKTHKVDFCDALCDQWGLDRRRTLAYAIDAARKRNPIGFFLHCICDGKHEPSDASLELAKRELSRKA
jgi:hypothetical protein